MYNANGNSLMSDTPAVKNIIIFTGIIYASQMFAPSLNITQLGALHYFKSPDFKPYQLVTAMFLHGSFMHLLFNMLTLFFFGTMLERYWGSKRFLFFYLACGIGASVIEQFAIPFLAQKFANGYVLPDGIAASIAEIKVAYQNRYSSLGASGAIMGLLAAFAYLFPNTPMYLMFLPIPIKAKYMVGIYILIDVFGGFSSLQGDNVAHFAHLGGALCGFIIVLFWNKTNRRTFY